MSAIGNSASDYFGRMARSYDSLIRRAVPRYDEMTDRLIEYLPPHAANILELGCGTGNLTLRLAERYPSARITAVDAAPEMTAATTSRASDAGIRNITTLTDRFENLKPAPGSFDLVTSCMSLHHVLDKGAIFKSIHAWLAPGGWLCFGDELLGASPHVQDIHWQRWLEFCRKPGGCTPEEIKGLLDHAAAHDHYAPLADQFSLLRAAGFSSVDCVWRDRMYSVVVAQR